MTQPPIALNSILPIRDPKKYKAHLATSNGKVRPLDAFVRDRSEWELWNRWRPGNDRFSRQYIFSLIDFYPEPDVWLFGGVYKVISRLPVSNSHSYEVELYQASAELVGRLKVRFKRRFREQSVMLENVYSAMTVSEILREPYSGKEFPGYENINHDFGLLETVFRSNNTDWYLMLRNAKGVYAIFDSSNGKKYVGSAYGDSGVWARWKRYIDTGHGGNERMTELIHEEGIEYARKNFRFLLLEYRPFSTDDQVIIERENYWKEALLSRGNFGYNSN